MDYDRLINSVIKVVLELNKNALAKFYGSWSMPLSMNWFMGVGGLALVLIVMWSIVWKGLALWKAARLGSKPWFVAFLVINTAGILEILYLYVFSKNGAHVGGE